MRLLLLAAIASLADGRPGGGASSYFRQQNTASQTGPGSSYGVPNVNTYVGAGQSRPTIQKHIYVHVPPPDLEYVAPPNRISDVQRAQKHYKIIFIKTPTAATQQVPVIPQQAQNQEKTLIYVLVKRPEDASQITIPTAAPTQPSKPEVYFIRYKTQKETTATGTGGNDGSFASGGVAFGGGGVSSFINTAGGPSVNKPQPGSFAAGGLGGESPISSYGPPGQSGPY